ncbi:uncharacterized protein Triagg1_9170 [Trichoderma aggressivum f. europaeum]|uniref:ATPase AAA-type core domain-containing protein n=1 Tax=Trichoderma aggressivum f. europaeum TaxID=173218 RepID=A0AAE1I7G3_9HYPO|nr:hypothetical protein Triagg1_9170 [Trichoderma aggressivum f. europaeum]
MDFPSVDNSLWNAFDQDGDAKHNISIAGKILHFLDHDAMDIGRRLEEIASGTSSGMIQFIDLWIMYPPGTLIFEQPRNAELSCYMVDSATFEKPSLDVYTQMSTLPPLKLHCWAIDYDGYFPGSLEISKLRYVPEKFLEDAIKVKAILKARGQAFWEMQGPSFRQVASDARAGSTKDESERVVVDRKTHRSLFGGWSLSPDQSKLDRGDNDDDDNDSVGVYSDQVLFNVPVSRRITSEPRVSSTWYSEYDDIDLLGQPDDLILLLCPKRVHAFCLRDKSWKCAAEAFQKPLYMVTAGDLGTDPENLEKLLKIFDYAVSWNAILLLDEADIFLQDRDYDNLQRNALVSIFLRTLEYFNGIMFLTINHVGAFDQAFQSRIHITIGMPEFDEHRRKDVWKILIQDLGRKRSDGSAILTHDECRELGREVVDSWAAQPLNGRQIRNCVRSALALAEDKGVKPNASHFNTVIRLGNAFTQYMKHLRKVEEDEIAQIKGDRLANMKAVLIDGSQKQQENDN